MRWSIESHLTTIRKYIGRLSVLSPEESAELDAAYAAIEVEQKSCHHRFQDVVSFTHQYKECMHCGKKES